MTCNATVVSAFQQGQLGFAMSDAGWLMPWYFGVIWALQQLGIITPGLTPIGAVSGGSVAAAASCLGLDFATQVMPAVHTTAQDCRQNNMCAGTLATKMGPSLTALFLPAAQNATALARCDASTKIYVSEGHPEIHVARGTSNFSGSVPRRVDSTDAQSFVEGIVATWYIPYWSDMRSFSTIYQGVPAYEGFYSLPMPCPENAKVCVRLSSRYPGPLLAKDSRISNMLQWSRFERPSEWLVGSVLDYASAAWFSKYQPPAPQHGDLYPGKYNRVRFTPNILAYKLSLTPGTKSELDYLFNLGKLDGAAWAKDMGLTDIAACQAAA